MKTLVIYYSYTGKTKIVAEKKAKEENADVLPLTLKKPRGKFLTYTAGSFAAMTHKKAKLNEFNVEFSNYEKFIIAMPIWAGKPAPAMNNILPLLPNGGKVEIIFTSGSGNSGKSGEYVKNVLAKNNIDVTSIVDIKESTIS